MQGGLWNKSQCYTLKNHPHQCNYSQESSQKSQTPSCEVLCTKSAITVNFAGFEIGLICTAACARASLISGSLCYRSWCFYSLYSDVKLSNFLFSNSLFTQFRNRHIYLLKYYNAQLQPLQTVYSNPIELGL